MDSTSLTQQTTFCSRILNKRVLDSSLPRIVIFQFRCGTLLIPPVSCNLLDKGTGQCMSHSGLPATLLLSSRFPSLITQANLLSMDFEQNEKSDNRRRPGISSRKSDKKNCKVCAAELLVVKGRDEGGAVDTLLFSTDDAHAFEERKMRKGKETQTLYFLTKPLLLLRAAYRHTSIYGGGAAYLLVSLEFSGEVWQATASVVHVIKVGRAEGVNGVTGMSLVEKVQLMEVLLWRMSSKALAGINPKVRVSTFINNGSDALCDNIYGSSNEFRPGSYKEKQLDKAYKYADFSALGSRLIVEVRVRDFDVILMRFSSRFSLDSLSESCQNRVAPLTSPHARLDSMRDSASYSLEKKIYHGFKSLVNPRCMYLSLNTNHRTTLAMARYTPRQKAARKLLSNYIQVKKFQTYRYHKRQKARRLHHQRSAALRQAVAQRRRHRAAREDDSASELSSLFSSMSQDSDPADNPNSELESDTTDSVSSGSSSSESSVDSSDSSDDQFHLHGLDLNNLASSELDSSESLGSSSSEDSSDESEHGYHGVDNLNDFRREEPSDREEDGESTGYGSDVSDGEGAEDDGMEELGAKDGDLESRKWRYSRYVAQQYRRLYSRRYLHPHSRRKERGPARLPFVLSHVKEHDPADFRSVLRVSPDTFDLV
ncbi:hypothetical protein SCHPADRAFT_947723 [Schizopora paradoxa]|uniref:Uncharacterized protein n=1 Tax=Schizopora paradoxa TaxID=27342 RepID=A0A0H2QZK4_9AGAM|nr:hypothetical protein SCHPADRAFT_947723 [Schizopora paradoxa]